MSIDVMAEKIKLCHTEESLFRIYADAIHFETIKNSLKILEVLLWGWTINEDMVNEV